MKFQFSIRDALKESWQIFTAHPWYFIVLAFVSLILNLVSRGEHVIIAVLVIIASIIWGYVWVSSSLAAVDGKHDMLQFSMIEKHLPSFTQFWKLIAVGVLSGLIIIAGTILLIIPGLYFMIKLSFANLAFVDRQGKITDALKYSWNITKGSRQFWKTVLVLLTIIGLVILGLIALGVGILIAYPLAMLLIAKLYRALEQQMPAQDVVVQPEEIPAHTEEIPSEPVQS